MQKTKYRELTKLFKNLRFQQIQLLIICTISALSDLYFAYLIQDLVDAVVSGFGSEALIQSFLHMCLVGVLSFLLGVYQTGKWHSFRYRLMNQMRTMMYEQLLTKKASFFDSRTTGDVTAAIMTDGSLIAETAGISNLMFFLNLLRIGMIAGVLLWKNAIMGIIEIVLAAVYFVCINVINKKMRSSYKEFSQETSNLNQRIVEDTKAIFEIKTLNEHRFFADKFKKQIWQQYDPSARKVIHIEVTSYAANEFVSILFPVIMLLLGGLFSYRGAITIGTVILFYTYTQKLVEPLNNMADFYRGTQMAVGAADRVYEYLYSTDEEKTESFPKKEKTVLDLDIRSFSWDQKRQILNHIHEKIQGGDKVFIQGESGSGKTTLLKLICGFYPVTDGSIRVNGMEVSRIREEELFDHMKVQFQEPVILEGTLRENIELGQKFSEQDILEALELASLGNFAREKGLDYYVTEAGKNLSGGQKQRLALARVFIRKPEIMILDEATSALDPENEDQIVANIKTFAERNQTILMVTSHRDKLKAICNKQITV